MFRKDKGEKASASNTVPAMSPGQLAYETRRASEAGLTLEAWLARKCRETARLQQEESRARAAPPKPRGRLSRLLDRAHKPLT